MGVRREVPPELAQASWQAVRLAGELGFHSFFLNGYDGRLDSLALTLGNGEYHQYKPVGGRLVEDDGRPRAVPSGDADSGYECPNMWCHAPLAEDYEFCPGCGSALDWDGYMPPCDEDAYDRRFDR